MCTVLESSSSAQDLLSIVLQVRVQSCAMNSKKECNTALCVVLSAIGKSVGLWDVGTGKELKQFQGHRDTVRCGHTLSAVEDEAVSIHY